MDIRIHDESSFLDARFYVCAYRNGECVESKLWHSRRRAEIHKRWLLRKSRKLATLDGGK